MSGIAGWIDTQRDLRDQSTTVTAMTHALRRRGPDSSGTWVSRRAALGQRRLHTQPEHEVDGPLVVTAPGAADVVLAFDGELYRTAGLYDALRHRGHRLRSRSDDELVLHAYLEWGEGCVERLDGMFAFAVWDSRTAKLFLARDRLGVKPLYYATYRDGLLFGSEPKAILANSLFTAEVDADGLVDVFAVAARRPGDAVYHGLAEVRPGHTLRATAGGVCHRPYWQLEAAPHTDDLPTTLARTRELVADAVESQLPAAVPMAALLSGGLDSSVISAFAARAMSGSKLSTYSFDFADSERDFTPDALHSTRDAPYVRVVADHLGTAHTEVVIDPPGLLEEMRSTLRARDLPGVGDLDTTLHLLFREVRKHASVVLSGEAADDLFGGYPWFLSRAEAQAPAPCFPWSAGVTDRNAMLSPELRASLDLDAAVAARYEESLTEVPRLPGESRVDARMREVFYLELTRFLPFLLERKDRMGMLHGLEVRLPFCDHRLVEYVWNVPWAMKRTGGQEKGLLREAAAGLLPESVARRQKSGFAFGQSPEYLRSVRDAVRELAADPQAPALQLLDRGKLLAMADSDAWSHGTFTPPPWLPRALLLNDWLTEYGVSVRL